MRYADLYVKAILTIIAGLLAWNTLSRFLVPTVHAQSIPSQYAAELLIFPLDLNSKKWDERTLATAINRGANGRELVSVVVPPSAGYLLAVYKQQSR
jgi:hypothetical protein